MCYIIRVGNRERRSTPTNRDLKYNEREIMKKSITVKPDPEKTVQIIVSVSSRDILRELSKKTGMKLRPLTDRVISAGVKALSGVVK